MLGGLCLLAFAAVLVVGNSSSTEIDAGQSGQQLNREGKVLEKRAVPVPLENDVVDDDGLSTFGSKRDLDLLEQEEEEYMREKYGHIVVKRDAPMGVSNHLCDDARTALTVDWDGDTDDYTCTGDILDPPRRKIYGRCEPTGGHKPLHLCMKRKLKKTADPPLSGNHRPLWAAYGEYDFLPWQRWLHNLEHGAIALLYNKCANQTELDKLRNMLTHCVRKHIITPYPLREDEPFALLSWGCILPLTHFDELMAFRFIKHFAQTGRENHVSANGAYRWKLKVSSIKSVGKSDNDICPQESFPELTKLDKLAIRNKENILGPVLTDYEKHREEHIKKMIANRKRRQMRRQKLLKVAKRDVSGLNNALEWSEDRQNEARRNKDWRADTEQNKGDDMTSLSERDADIANLETGLAKLKKLFHTNVQPYLH